MAKIKVIVPEDIELPSVADTPPEQVEHEAMQEQAIWDSLKTIQPMLWEANIIHKGIRYSGVLLSDTKPDMRRGVALISTRYDLKPDELLDMLINERGTVYLVSPLFVYRDEDINNNYIPF